MTELRDVTERVWNVRNVRSATEGAAGSWGLQAVVYAKTTRSDGMPVWKLERALGPVHTAGSESARRGAAVRDGEANAGPIERSGHARHGGLALGISDILDDPAAESEWRLGGRTLKLVFASPTSKSKRMALALAEKTKRGGGYRLVKRLGTISRKQLKEDIARLSIPWARAEKLPRTPGKVVEGVE
jgi:hypothetical protein